MSNIIAVGRDGASKYVAYGDDCYYPPVFCGFAWIVVPRTRISRLLRGLAEIKAVFGMREDQRIHCRELFHADPRRKAGLSHLTDADAQAIVIRCMLLMNDVGVHVRFSHTRRDDFVSAMGNTFTFGNSTDGSFITVPLHDDAKGIISLLAQMALIAPARDARFRRSEEWELVISSDTTKTRLIGDKRQQAHNLVTPFSAIGAPEGMVFQLNPRISDESRDPLLQLADVAAYALTHALDTTERNAFWRKELPGPRLLHVVPYAPVKYLSEPGTNDETQ